MSQLPSLALSPILATPGNQTAASSQSGAPLSLTAFDANDAQHELVTQSQWHARTPPSYNLSRTSMVAAAALGSSGSSSSGDRESDGNAAAATTPKRARKKQKKNAEALPSNVLNDEEKIDLGLGDASLAVDVDAATTMTADDYQTAMLAATDAVFAIK